MLLEKRFFLNGSNTKWISIGITPASKILAAEASGFHIDIFMSGAKMAPMSLCGIDGLMTLCQSLRALDEFKYAYPGTAMKYEEIEKEVPMTIGKKYFGGSLCYHFESANGSAFIAMTSVMELLKHESLLNGAAKYLEALVPDIERKFNDFVTKASSDLAAAITDADKSGDLLLIEVVTNFGDLYKFCVEQIIRNNELNLAAAKPPNKRVYKAPAKILIQKPKPSSSKGKKREEEHDHTYAPSEKRSKPDEVMVDTEEVVEEIETGQIETGQLTHDITNSDED